MKRRAIHYTKEELAWIKKHATRTRKEAHHAFCATFDRSDVTLKNYNALCKRKGWKTGRTGQFSQGADAWNKGKKMPYNANSARTQFKKGQTPHNTKYAGHERVTKDGYIEVSVNEQNPHTGFERRYVLKHRYLWEQANGPIPSGMCLKCLDGNKQNTCPGNWEAVERSTLAFLNKHVPQRYDSAPDEVKPVILTLAKLQATQSKRKNTA